MAAHWFGPEAVATLQPVSAPAIWQPFAPEPWVWYWLAPWAADAVLARRRRARRALIA